MNFKPALLTCRVTVWQITAIASCPYETDSPISSAVMCDHGEGWLRGGGECQAVNIRPSPSWYEITINCQYAILSQWQVKVRTLWPDMTPLIGGYWYQSSWIQFLKGLKIILTCNINLYRTWVKNTEPLWSKKDPGFVRFKQDRDLRKKRSESKEWLPGFWAHSNDDL